MDFKSKPHRKKSFGERLLNLCGYEIWPPTHGDPRIKGPQPRIITRRQKKWMEKLQTGRWLMMKCQCR